LVDSYESAKLLAVGFGTNNASDYSRDRKKVQDNSYWNFFDQMDYNLKIYIPAEAEVENNTLVVHVWDGSGVDETLTFGQLVALYGDYRRTVHCDELGDPMRCHLTNRDDPQYMYGGLKAPGTIYFEHGEDCFSFECGWEPDPRPTRFYLRDIGSGLVPPFGNWGNAVSNTAWPEEELDAAWWGDEMLRIAKVNDWHFSEAAVAWYVGMHRLALLYARSARTDDRYWNKALHYEANALHSLTDLFAFGHVVTARDATSYGIMTNKGLTNDEAFLWMENALAMGGGTRTPEGRVQLTSLLPSIQDRANPRNDFMASDAGTWASYAVTEKGYHDQFNTSGATVLNLKRQEFAIGGDGMLRYTSGATQDIIAEAVRASLQSLFDAYESPRSTEEIGAAGSSYFDALLNIPVFVTSPGPFWGQWTRYAIAVDAITDAGIVPGDARDCMMPLVDGGIEPPVSRHAPCTTPDRPTGAAVLAELLHRDGALPRGDQLGLDAAGNANGAYDVGDFLAWVRANDATPVTFSGMPASAPKGVLP